jgi:hypothetical protein
MPTSQSDIEAALSPVNLGQLSELMLPKKNGLEKREGEKPPAQNASQDGGPEKKAGADHGDNVDKGHSASSPAEKRQEGNRRRKIAATSQSLKKQNPEQPPEGRPSTPDVKRPTAERSKKRHRAAERPTFTIGADQMATLRVLGSSRRDPLGSSASEIARRLFDLFGYNGRHPVAALHGQALSDNASTPGPLIEERQWEDLLAKADVMVVSLANPTEESPADGFPGGESLGGESLDEDEARLACICYLVQEALYEAGFGDRRRRRKDPF